MGGGASGSDTSARNSGLKSVHLIAHLLPLGGVRDLNLWNVRFRGRYRV